ncbi:MAG: sulfatase-like hydrolase/transferase, partial [Acidobacteriota bacterium]
MKTAVAAAALLSVMACRGGEEAEAPSAAAPPPSAPARHIVLVTVDTLRADHLGAYGSDVATPNFDRLASEGVLVEQAVAHVPLTRPSHVAMMSGLLPSVTGVRDNVSPSEIPDVPLLAEVLAEEGFATGAFVSAVVISRASGLGRGFDRYSDEFLAKPQDPRFLNTAQKPGDETVAEAIGWLEEQLEDSESGPRVFLWLHLYDPHEPYDPPEPYASRYPDRPYAGEVAWTDELIGRVDEVLRRHAVDDETLFVVTSDHGEGLGEHDELLHGFFAYESTLRVPLIARGPGIVPGSRLEAVAGLVDLYPTLLDLAGVAVPQEVALSGRSLASAWRGGEILSEVPVYAETLVPQLKFGWSDLRVLRDGRFKFIQAPRPELYDVVSDPGELDNLVQRERGRAGQMRDALAALLASQQPLATSSAASPDETSPDLLEQLGALGYVGSVTASTATPGADPKDKIEEFRIANALLRQGMAKLHEGDFEASVDRLQELLSKGIDSSEIHLNLARALLEARRFAPAAEHFLEVAARTPNQPQAWLGVAEARAQLGDPAGAIEALRAGQGQLPRHIGLRREEARLLRLQRRPAEARAALEGAIEIAPQNAFLRAGLSEVLRDLGDLDGATEQLRRATELAPQGAEYWNAYGMMLGGTGQFPEAEKAFREAWRLDSTD